MMNINQLTQKFVIWLDEKIIWNRSRLMRWYCNNIYRERCFAVGNNLELTQSVKRPIIQGRGKIRIGNNVTIYGAIELVANTTTFPECEIIIGDDVIIGKECSIKARKKVKIGCKCLLGPFVRIYDHNGHPIEPELRLNNGPTPKNEVDEVIIGDNVWIGEFAQIQKGVTIGEGSIVAAHSIVTRNVEPNSVVFGIPARKILWLKS